MGGGKGHRARQKRRAVGAGARRGGSLAGGQETGIMSWRQRERNRPQFGPVFLAEFTLFYVSSVAIGPDIGLRRTRS
jgi:hypothetical protein